MGVPPNPPAKLSPPPSSRPAWPRLEMNCRTFPHYYAAAQHRRRRPTLRRASLSTVVRPWPRRRARSTAAGSVEATILLPAGRPVGQPTVQLAYGFFALWWR